jgi:ABC-type multidrug transport system fused ATPase/permease subunit
MSRGSRPGALPAWLRGGFELLTARERVAAFWLAAGLVAHGLLDALAVSAVFPFVGIVVDPALIHSNRAISTLHAVMGAPGYADFVRRLATAVLALLALNAAVSWLLQYVLNLYAAKCQTRLARELLTECVAAPYPWFLTRNATRLSRLFYDDVSQWSRGFVQRLMTITNAGIIALIGTALVLAMAPVTGAIALVLVGGSAGAAMSYIRPRLTRLSRQKREALDRTMLSATQVLSGIKDVKLSSRGDFFVQLFVRSYSATSRLHARLNAWQQVLPLGLPVLGQAVLIAVALLMIGAGTSAGEVAAQMALLVLVSSRVVPAIGQLSTSAGLLWNVAPYVEGIQELRRSLAEATAAGENRAARTWDGQWTRMALRNVGYRYPQADGWALRGVELEIVSGCAYGIAGPSGAGKTTLVDVILALLDPSEGQVLLDGRPFGEIARAAWQAGIGYVPQTPYLADDTLRANVAFGVRRKDVDDGWVLDCLERASLAEFVRELPQGLDTPLGDRGLRASGGQRQRIAIARALYNRPRLLVLDEATSALDRIAESAVQEAIERLRGRLTTLTIAHRLSTIRRCDVIFLLSSGRVVGRGSYAQLEAASALFRQMAAEPPLAEAAAVPPA